MDNIEKGKQLVDSFIEKYGDLPLSELPKFIPDEDKTKTALIKKMLDDSNTSIDTLAKYLDCKPQSLRNKMFRNSFSIDDLIICAHVCNFSVVLKNNATNVDAVIDIVEFFKPLDDDVLVRISDLDKESKAAKRAEYDRLKAQLDKMKAELGFEE